MAGVLGRVARKRRFMATLSMEWITTSAILADLRGGDVPSAWERFVAIFRPAVVAYARRAGLDEAASEDVAQATLLSFVTGLRAGAYRRGEGSLRAWLFTIAHHRTVDVLRTRARHTLVEASARVLEGDAATSVWREVFAGAVLAQCLERVRTEMSARTLAVFLATWVDDEPVAEVARRHDMTENAVYLARLRVLARLRELGKELEDVG